MAPNARRGMVPHTYGYSDELVTVKVKLAGIFSLPVLSLIPFLTGDRPRLLLTVIPERPGLELRAIGILDRSSRPISTVAWSSTDLKLPICRMRIRLKPIHPTGEHDYYLSCQLFDRQLVQPEYGESTGLRSSGDIILETGVVRDKGIVVWGFIAVTLPAAIIQMLNWWVF